MSKLEKYKDEFLSTIKEDNQINCENYVLNYFNIRCKDFIDRKEKSININALFENEIEKLKRFKEIEPCEYDKFDIKQFYLDGWNMPTDGTFIIKKPVYSFYGMEIINMSKIPITKRIQEKYVNNPPQDFIKNFEKKCISLMKEAMTDSVYYHWLIEQQKELLATKTIEPNKYAEKWYGYTYAILVHLEKKNKPTKNEKGQLVKSEIDIIGKELYKCGGGFYKGFKAIDTNKMNPFVRSLGENTPDRENWKSIITNISRNDADVIFWLKKQPN